MLKQQFCAAGNVAKDAEMRFTPSGATVTSVNVGINDGYMGKDEQWVDRTMWVRLQFWGQAAEKIAEKAKKGMPIVFRGKFVYNDKGNPRVFNLSDGTPAASFEIKVDEYQLFNKLGSAPVAEGDGGQAEDVPTSTEDESIPF